MTIDAAMKPFPSLRRAERGKVPAPNPTKIDLEVTIIILTKNVASFGARVRVVGLHRDASRVMIS